MVGGDINQDGVINAADRVLVRQMDGLQLYEGDITGDRYINALDRTIVDRNYGRVSSLLNVSIPNANTPAINDESNGQLIAEHTNITDN